MAAPVPGLTALATSGRVVDGDTIDVELRWKARVRLSGCWAPEMTGPDKQAGERAKVALEKLLPEGTPVVVKIDSHEADDMGDLLTFGRVVGEVWRVGDDSSLSDAMVEAGLAWRTKAEQRAAMGAMG